VSISSSDLINMICLFS